MERKIKRKNLTVTLIVIFVLLVIGIIAGVFVMHARSYVSKTIKKYEGRIIDNVYIEGINVSGMTKETAESRLNSYISHNAQKAVITLKSERNKKRFRAEKLNIDYKTKDAVNEAYGIGRDGTAITNYFKLHEILEENNIEKVKVEKTADAEAAEKIVDDSKKRFTKEPVNASLIAGLNNKVKLIKQKNGTSLKKKETTRELVDFIENDWDFRDSDVDAIVSTKEPKITNDDLKGMDDILGRFKTTYDYGYTNRRINIENGTKKLNGSIIAPGKELSVYKKVGPFTEKNGYHLAGTYAGGDVVDDFGGGICQVATTLYNAAILAELKIKERHNHIMPVHYVQLSFDAAISGQSDDLKFVNNLDDPIYISGRTSDKGVVAFAVIGKETRDKDRKIKFTSKTTSVIPPGTSEISDSSMMQGTRVVEKYGVTGYSAELWKTIYKKGKKKKSYKFNSSHYSPVTQVVRVGTKKPEKKEDDKEKKNEKGSKGSKGKKN